MFCFLILLVAVGVCFYYQDIIFNYALQLGSSIGFDFVYISPEEVMVQKLNLAFMCGFMITLPFIILQLCLFISAGLKLSARFITVLYGVFALAFYILGAVFAIKILLPNIFTFMLKANTLSNVLGTISVAKYLSFAIRIIVILGLIFEMPIVSSILAFCHIINAKLLRHIRPYIIVIIFIVAAIVTPPDVISQFFVAIPMICLYELSIITALVITKPTRRGKTNEKVNS